MRRAVCGIVVGSMFCCADTVQDCDSRVGGRQQRQRRCTGGTHASSTFQRREDPKTGLVFHYVMLKYWDLTCFFPLFYLAVLFLRGSSHGFCGPARADIVPWPCVGVSLSGEGVWELRKTLILGTNKKRKKKKPQRTAALRRAQQQLICAWPRA